MPLAENYHAAVCREVQARIDVDPSGSTSGYTTERGSAGSSSQVKTGSALTESRVFDEAHTSLGF